MNWQTAAGYLLALLLKAALANVAILLALSVAQGFYTWANT